MFIPFTKCFTEAERKYVNYTSPKGNVLVTVQSYKRLTPPTFNFNRYDYLK